MRSRICMIAGLLAVMAVVGIGGCDKKKQEGFDPTKSPVQGGNRYGDVWGVRGPSQGSLRLERDGRFERVREVAGKRRNGEPMVETVRGRWEMPRGDAPIVVLDYGVVVYLGMHPDGQSAEPLAVTKVGSRLGEDSRLYLNLPGQGLVFLPQMAARPGSLSGLRVAQRLKGGSRESWGYREYRDASGYGADPIVYRTVAEEVQRRYGTVRGDRSGGVPLVTAVGDAVIVSLHSQGAADFWGTNDPVRQENYASSDLVVLRVGERMGNPRGNLPKGYEYRFVSGREVYPVAVADWHRQKRRPETREFREMKEMVMGLLSR